MSNIQYPISNLRLRNFRSYDDFAVELSDEVNIIVGANASGKTNLLESVLLIGGTKPYRTNIVNTIRNGQNWATIEASLGSVNRSLKIKKKDDKIEKIFDINNNVKKRLNFEEKLPIILFEPEHMRLLTGSPELRRVFLDDVLAETDYSYDKLLNSYKRALLQRNKLLKAGISAAEKQIFVWNIRLSELAGQIVAARIKLIKELNKKISYIYSQIAGEKTKITLDYDSKIKINNYESSLLHMLEKSIDLDCSRGFTAYGPHREDLVVKIRNLPADINASRGETRTLVLSLKILEKELLEQARDKRPIILFDDVFSELDGVRRKSLTEHLKNYQTIITTTDADIISKNFAQAHNLISL